MDNASDRKDMESHLIDKLGSWRPGGINEKLEFVFVFLCGFFFFFFASLCSPFFPSFFTLETSFTNSLDLV